MLHSVREMVLRDGQGDLQGREYWSKVDSTREGKQPGGECLADELDKSRIGGQERGAQTGEGSP